MLLPAWEKCQTKIYVARQDGSGGGGRAGTAKMRWRRSHGDEVESVFNLGRVILYNCTIAGTHSIRRCCRDICRFQRVVCVLSLTGPSDVRTRTAQLIHRSMATIPRRLAFIAATPLRSTLSSLFPTTLSGTNSAKCRRRARVPTRYQHSMCSERQSPTRNFFLNTSLSRNGCTSFDTDLNNILRHSSDTHRFIPIWREKPIVERIESNAHDDNQRVNAVLWDAQRVRQWHKSLSDDSTKSFSPFVAALAKCTAASTYFALDVSASDPAPLAPNEQLASLRRAVGMLQCEQQAALVAHAKALLSWHASARFCSRCGEETVVVQGGAARRCVNTECITNNIYPRVMPSVIMLVLRNNGSDVLLGRKASWPPRRYSLLAGYAELFESLEQTVVREVFEEAGVVVDENSIVYHSSQPWPSEPQCSLMSGFRAHVTSAHNSRIRVDKNELQDAKWFSKSWLRANIDSPHAITLPSSTSLARRLIMEWLNEPDNGAAT